MDVAIFLLELIKTLRWPAVVLIIVFVFRMEIRAALQRIAQVRAGPIEIHLREMARRLPEFFEEEG